MFHFMVHDKWSNVLMLHWCVPSHLEPILADHVSPFQLDRTEQLSNNDATDKDKKKIDGDAWIGLILITEQNVGPAIFRSNWTTVTHHGVNVRTYIKGPDVDVGIHFASLECDDAITSFGANIFGMPYRVANMERTFGISAKDNAVDGENADHETEALLGKDVLSTSEIDDMLCADGDINGRVQTFTMKSSRATKRSNPSLIDFVRSLLFLFFGMIHKMLIVKNEKNKSKNNQTGSQHSTKIKIMKTISDSSNVPPPVNNNRSTLSNVMDNAFTIEAQWERHLSPSPLSPKRASLAHFFFERYHVYTTKYGLRWKGTIQHEPWPIEEAKLKNLIISNIDAYEPKHMRPILRYMAENDPNSFLFSRGVGPIQFEMLRPV